MESLGEPRRTTGLVLTVVRFDDMKSPEAVRCLPQLSASWGKLFRRRANCRRAGQGGPGI